MNAYPRANMRAAIAAAAAVLLLATCKLPLDSGSGTTDWTIAVQPATLTLTPGQQSALTAEITSSAGAPAPTVSITWHTSDAAIATVSTAGTVVAVAVGTATITATATEDQGSGGLVRVRSSTATITVAAVTPPPPPPPPPPPSGDPVLVGAGDIASCDSDGDEATALLLDNIPGTVITIGDNVYNDGFLREFMDCYEPSWGRHKARTKPSIGNHEYYGTTDAAGYFDYFGGAAGERGKGYYSYNVGAWHVVVINNMIDVAATSQQATWLKADLTANPAKCTLAYWHYPLFSSGDHGNQTKMRAIWQILYDAGVDLVLNGHDHHYERFAPQDPNGVADPARGIREFIVGTGGASDYAMPNPQPNSEVRHTGTFGVLKLTLHASSYTWQFVPIAGKTFTDAGTAACH